MKSLGWIIQQPWGSETSCSHLRQLGATKLGHMAV